MQYLGGKTRIAKEILPLILSDRKEGRYFVEPFCGGRNVTDKVSGNRIANDYNEYLIAMFRGLVSGEKYPEQTDRELFDDVKKCFRSGSDKYDPGFMGRVGFMASYRGKFFSGYSGTTLSKGKPYDRIAESVRGVMRQIPRLQGVEFRTGDYRSLQIPDESIIYCDPPYMNAKCYMKDNFKNRNHEKEKFKRRD